MQAIRPSSYAVLNFRLSINNQCAIAVQKTPRHKSRLRSVKFKVIGIKSSPGNNKIQAIRSCQKTMITAFLSCIFFLFIMEKRANKIADSKPHISPLSISEFKDRTGNMIHTPVNARSAKNNLLKRICFLFITASKRTIKAGKLA